MCKTRHVPPPLPKPAGVVDNTAIDNSQSILHVNLSQHIVLMSTTVGLISLLLLCLGIWCVKERCLRCLRSAVTPQEGRPTARYPAAACYNGSGPSNSMIMQTFDCPMGPVSPYNTPYTAPCTSLYITNTAEDSQSVEHSSDYSPSAPTSERNAAKDRGRNTNKRNKQH